MTQTQKMTIAVIGIVMNIVLGTLVSTFQIPLLFLDTIGTIFVAVLLGPVYGATAGGLTNVTIGIMTNPRSIPFALVNIAIGLIVGFVSRKYNFNLVVAIITGLVLAVVAPLIGTPIAVFLYGGLTGGGMDLFVTWLSATGEKLFTAAFIPRVAGNLIDKVASTILVALLLSRIPKRYLPKVNEQK